ncbi:unnamed protein product [Linum tenue]|uniref:DUF4283 domain-containing protein n=1 Tax=Linum tenue TaxID=586396 RepID=A0AAV0HW98_9ROSI|nr:unnamed protein product [Linum tenue]
MSTGEEVAVSEQPTKPPDPGVSFKDRLLGRRSASPAHAATSEFLLEKEVLAKVHIDYANGNKLMPMMRLSDDLLQEECQAWKNAIIIKPYGNTVGHHLLVNRLHTLWTPAAEMEVLELGNGFSVVKFEDPEDLTRVISGGPYIIAGKFLAIQLWTPGFNPFSSRISTLLTWVRFTHLPTEYYRDEILFTLASCMGRPVRIDRQTALVTRGCYARVCVEIKLDEPLVPKVWVANAWRLVEYEGIHAVCGECGRAGHLKEATSTKSSPWRNGKEEF